MGREIGQSISESPTEIDVNALTLGLQDAMNKRPSLISPEEEEKVKAEFSAKIQEEQSKKMAALAEENSNAETAFLAKNKSVKGVVTTASGLQYQVLKEGNGPKPSETDRVKVHYLGKLIDGKEFDSSYTRNEPAVFSERCHPRLDGGPSAHEDRRHVSRLGPLEAGVWRPRRRQDDRPQRPVDLRCGAARNCQRMTIEKERRKRSSRARRDATGGNAALRSDCALYLL
jgi:hypothetical protein